jgi:hypothetical protein
MHLEDFVKKHKDAFDVEDPSEGHWERFEHRLQDRKRKKRTIRMFRWVAAVVIGIMAGSLFFLNPKNKKEVYVLSEETKEMREYYSSVMNEEVNRLRSVLQYTDAGIRDEVMKDALQIIKDTEISADDFSGELNTENAHFIMVKEYKKKISALQSMILFFEENK